MVAIVEKCQLMLENQGDAKLYVFPPKMDPNLDARKNKFSVNTTLNPQVPDKVNHDKFIAEQKIKL